MTDDLVNTYSELWSTRALRLMVMAIAGFSFLILACASSAGNEDMGEFKITYVHRTYGKDAHGPAEVLVYETATKTERSVEMDYWPLMRNALCGDDEGTPESHRFYGLTVDVTTCPEIKAAMERHKISPDWRRTIGQTSCHQERGLVAYTAYLFREERWGTGGGTKGIMVCDLHAIYSVDLDTLLFVDSVDRISPTGENVERFYGGDFDHLGENFYYHKHGTVHRYNIAARRIDTLKGFQDFGIPPNSMEILAISETDRALCLLDDSSGIVSSISADFDYVGLVYSLGDSVFVITYPRPDLGSHYYTPSSFAVVDFKTGIKRELFLTDDEMQILNVERVESTPAKAEE